LSCGQKLLGPRATNDKDQSEHSAIPGTGVFKVNLSLIMSHAPSALEARYLRYLEAPPKPGYCRYFVCAFRLLYSGRKPMYFLRLLQGRFASVIEYAPLRYATLAHLAVRQANTLTSDARQFLDLYYKHTRAALSMPSYVDFVIAASLVLHLWQNVGWRDCGFDHLSETELLFVSMVIRCCTSLGHDINGSTEECCFLHSLYQYSIRRVFELPLDISLTPSQSIQMLRQAVDIDVAFPSQPSFFWDAWVGEAICYYFLRYVGLCTTGGAGTQKAQRIWISLIHALSNGLAHVSMRLQSPRLSVHRRQCYDEQYLIVAALQTILTPGPSGWRSGPSVRAARSLILPTPSLHIRKEMEWKIDIFKLFIAGLVLTPDHFPQGIFRCRQRAYFIRTSKYRDPSLVYTLKNTIIDHIGNFRKRGSKQGLRIYLEPQQRNT